MNEISKLDAIDRKIISVLQQDGGLSNAELGERVGASAASAWRRVKALEQAGVLLRPVRLADQDRLGLGVTVFCHVRLTNHSAEARNVFERFVEEQPQIMECYAMTGDWDFTMRIVASDIADFNRFLMNRILRHPSVDGASSTFALQTTKYTTALPV